MKMILACIVAFCVIGAVNAAGENPYESNSVTEHIVQYAASIQAQYMAQAIKQDYILSQDNPYVKPATERKRTFQYMPSYNAWVDVTDGVPTFSTAPTYVSAPTYSTSPVSYYYGDGGCAGVSYVGACAGGSCAGISACSSGSCGVGLFGRRR